MQCISFSSDLVSSEKVEAEGWWSKYACSYIKLEATAEQASLHEYVK